MTGKQRLKVLANYLTSGAVDESKFNMNKWDSCAIGEGAHLATLEKDGLVLERNSNGFLVPGYDSEKCYEACARFFSMPHDVARRFFGPKNRTAKTVGRQLLNYLNQSHA